MIEDAIAFAAQEHIGQTDKLGEPYILHPLRVMLAVKAGGGSEEEMIAAVLHDVVEDTDTTLEEIGELFGAEVAKLVDSLSRRDGEEYLSFIERAAMDGASAIRIKKADLADNSDPNRLGRLEPEQRRSLEAKYGGAFEVIERVTRDRPEAAGR